MPPKITLDGETKYQLLVQISQQVRDTLDLDAILNHLLDALQSVLDYDAAGIFVLNRDIALQHAQQPRAMIAGVARRGYDPHPDADDRMLMRGEGITGHVIRTGQAIVVPDVRLDPRYVVGRAATLSEIAVPIVRNENAIGALDVESDRLGAFDESDLEILRFFADAAAISIEKAMLHRQLLDRQHMDEQLRTARAVQTRLLPAQPPAIPGYDIAGLSLPAYEIGGDYFDYIPLAGGKLGIALADVAGKGIPAALVMTAFRALLRTISRPGTAPAQVMAEVNRLLPDIGGASDFVTAVFGVLDPASGRFAYANCGHPEMLFFRAGGQFESLGQGGSALGVFRVARCASGEAALASGDLLVLHTDGVVELENQDRQEYGVRRLVEAVWRSVRRPAADIIQNVVQSTRDFSGFETYDDDFTLIVLRRQ